MAREYSQSGRESNGAVLAAPVTFSLTALGQAARASENKPVIVSILERNTILPLAANTSTTSPVNVARYMNRPTLLEGLAEIDENTCTEIAVGAWTPTPDQAYGTEKCGVVTTGTVTSTVGIGPCPGSTFTFATIYYEWTAHNNQSINPNAQPNTVTDTFNATWATPDGMFTQFYTFNIAVPVVRPDHETTAFDSWNGPHGLWKQTLVPPSSDPTFDFSKEIVQEFAAGPAGPDMWFDKSGRDPFIHVTNDPNDPESPWHVEPGNTYSFDGVGYGSRAVCRYRNGSPTLKQFGICGTRFGQEMKIHAPSDPGPTNPPTTWTPYGNTNTGNVNLLGASMTKPLVPFAPAPVTSIRAGMSRTEGFVTGPVCP
jgi:hypothetical protein